MALLRTELLVAALAFMSCALASAGQTVLPAAQERIVRRTPVQGGGNLIGEVRILKRGDERVVEVVIVTGLLRRVIGEIRDKELANWPAGQAGHDDALAYVSALEEARNELAEKARRSPGGGAAQGDHRLKMAIEFASSARAFSLTLWDVEAEREGDGYRVTSRRKLRTVAVGRDYVDRNMVSIVADSFRVSEEEAAAALAK
jgi:hypothetical protein